MTQAALGRAALAKFGIEPTRLRLLRHQHNTTFGVEAKEGRFALRVNRPGLHGLDTIGSEVAWLQALTQDTDLGVPEPVPALDGSYVVTLEAEHATRCAVLMRWQKGRFYDDGLRPVHLRRVGGLEASLQDHAGSWSPRVSFRRPRVDALTTPARLASISQTPVVEGPIPSDSDAEIAIALVTELLGRNAVETCARAIECARTATATTASTLLHADLHYENVLFHQGQVRAIDFDDCGWGQPLYDLAVTLWELEERPGYPDFRRALFEGYSSLQPLPANPEATLAKLFVLRKLQMLMWILESRDHAAFKLSWHEWAHEEIGGIASALAREPHERR